MTSSESGGTAGPAVPGPDDSQHPWSNMMPVEMTAQRKRTRYRAGERLTSLEVFLIIGLANNTRERVRQIAESFGGTVYDQYL